MKKALSFLLIGALTYGAFDLYLNNRCTINRHLREIKEKGTKACQKVKSLF